MTKDLKTIADDLRAKLEYETDLGSVMCHFYDEVGEDDRVMDASVPAESPMLRTVLESVLTKLAGPAVARRAELRLTYCAEIGLQHGPFRAGPWHGVVLALDGCPVGMVHATRGGVMQEYFRFRIAPLVGTHEGSPS